MSGDARLTPPRALSLPVANVLKSLREVHGSRLDEVLEGPFSSVPSPVPAQADPSWLTKTHMIGINVRTVGSFWRVVHYLRTVPAIYNAVHLLPIWEPGVVGSLYGMASWEINDEFFDAELAAVCPRLSTPGAQLAAMVRVLHLEGRAVGLDVIPHTDRFSQIVLAQPHFFEWLRRRGTSIVDHREDLAEEVAQAIYRFAVARGPAVEPPQEPAASTNANPLADCDAFFSPGTPESVRNHVLFGAPCERAARVRRRDELITHLHELGYEPAPATMAPPYRGLALDARSPTVDAAGRTWYEYRMTRPASMSRVFGPLARYRFYGRRDNNRNWEIDFAAPRLEVFDYLASHIVDLQARFGFAFMRGDMSHVQMRPRGVPLRIDATYDPLAYVKRRVREHRPSFAYFAESFLSPPGVMAYGDEVEHLEASEAEVTLGDLQSVAIDAPEFLPRLRRYYDIAASRAVTPCFTVMTGDKDDPRFDEFYLAGNELRLFLSLFLPTLPSYIALGFELRDRHETPADNEYYTKLYVFHEESGPKATRGPYRFGSNVALYDRVVRIRRFAAQVLPQLLDDRADARPHWLLAPDATAGTASIAWARPTEHATIVFVANTSTSRSVERLLVPLPPTAGPGADALAEALFSTAGEAGGRGTGPVPASARVGRGMMEVAALGPGEGRAYRVVANRGGSSE